MYGNPSNSEDANSNIAFRSIPSTLATITVPCPSPKHGTSGIQLLSHFYSNWNYIFNIPGRDEVASLSKSNTLVRNTVLAISACHLRHMSPARVEHRIAEHFYGSLVIRDYQTALETPANSLGQEGADAMLLVAMLLNMIAFTLPHQKSGVEIDPSSSWVFSSREDRLGWLALQTGLRPLLLSLSTYVAKTVGFLDPILFGHRRAGWTEARKPQSLDIVPDTWVRVFKLKNDSSSCDSHVNVDPNDVLRPAALALAYLQGIDPSQSTIFLNLMFLMKIHGDFRFLLYNKDERALWLFGYWLGLMCRYEGIWWSEQRVRRDYQAVCMWLDALQLSKRAGGDALYWNEMMQELKQAPVFMSKEH